MILKDTISGFLGIITNSSREIYKNKIEVFYNFLVSEKGINDKSYHSYLEGMKVDEVIESLDYYIEQNNIRSESMSIHFISVVKKYFSFLYNLNIKNDNLIKSFGLSEEHSDSFQRKLKSKIYNDQRLDKKETKTELSWDEVEVLISECDQNIKEAIDKINQFNYDKFSVKYNDLMSSIIIKLLLFTGVKYKYIRNIKYDKNNIARNVLDINGYYIHLPNNLFDQLSYYLKIRDEILKNLNVDSNTLFINYDGSELAVQTNIIADTLKSYIGRSDLTGIIKFVIIEMIKKGINQSVIQDFTKVGIEIYKYCQDLVNDNKNSSVSRYLDSKMRNLEIFDLM